MREKAFKYYPPCDDIAPSSEKCIEFACILKSILTSCMDNADLKKCSSCQGAYETYRYRKTTTRSCIFPHAADLIFKLTHERDTALFFSCVLCGICPPEDRHPLQCEIIDIDLPIGPDEDLFLQKLENKRKKETEG